MEKIDLDRMKLVLSGGKGSGNFGHAGRPGKRGGSAPGSGKSTKSKSVFVPGWSTGSDKKTADEFVKARSRVPENKQPYLSQYTADELVKNGGTIFVSEDGMSGFVIAKDGDIQNVFSANHRGKDCLRTAIKNGGTKLDCFDGFLPGYYSQFGFEEYKREANWTPGGPDVIFMRLP